MGQRIRTQRCRRIPPGARHKPSRRCQHRDKPPSTVPSWRHPKRSSCCWITEQISRREIPTAARPWAKLSWCAVNVKEIDYTPVIEALIKAGSKIEKRRRRMDISTERTLSASRNKNPPAPRINVETDASSARAHNAVKMLAGCSISRSQLREKWDFHREYSVTFPSTTAATYFPDSRSRICTTRCPSRANFPHRLGFSGFCSIASGISPAHLKPYGPELPRPRPCDERNATLDDDLRPANHRFCDGTNRILVKHHVYPRRP